MSVVTAEVKNELLGILSAERKEYEKIIEEKTKGIVDPIRADVLHKLESRYNELQALIEKPVNPTLTADAQQKQDLRNTKAALNELLRKGRVVTNAYEDIPEVKSMVTSVDAQGGYLVTPDSSGRVVAKIYETSPMRQHATVQTLSSDTLDGLIDNDEASSGWVGEQGTRSDTNTPELGKYRIEAFEQYAHAKISQKLLDDAGIDVAAWLEGKLAGKFARTENDAFVNGDGIAKPRGFCTYTTAATDDSSRAWGQFEHVLSGASAAFAASNPADKIIELIGKVKSNYLANSKFFMTREVLTAARKLKATADTPYLYMPSLVAGAPSQLNGYDVILMQDMPALAADSLSLAFGDMAATYTIADRLGYRLMRDPFTAKPFIIFYATKRTGGGAVNFEALKFIKFNT